jgi:exopolysaccharide biosynthesis polyprenyl glycosylphosphotransferase
MSAPQGTADGRDLPSTNGHEVAATLPDGLQRSPHHNGVVWTPGEQPSRDTAHSPWQYRYAARLRVVDTVVVCGAVALAQYLRFGLPPFAPGDENGHATACSVLTVIIWLSFLAGFHTRSTRIIGRGAEEYRRAVEASIWTFGAIAMTEYVFHLEIARGYLAVALPVGILGLLTSRSMARHHVAGKRADGSYQTTVLALGSGAEVVRLADELTRRPSDGFRVVAACVPDRDVSAAGHLVVRDRAIPVVGAQDCDATTLVRLIREFGADTLAIVGTEHLGVQQIRRLIWTLEPLGVELMVSPGVMDVAVSRLTMLPIAGLPLLHIEKPQYRGAERFQKRAFDLCFAAVALLVVFPILLLAAVAIKTTSSGPVFYLSERIGLGGKPFKVFKLRTMVSDADTKLVNLLESNECDGHLFKIKNDPRVTPVGRLLRRFSIDELPQFINVLRREMSVVGPRPLFWLRDEEQDSDSLRRLLVKPGITGLWQVSGRSDLSWDDAIRLDLSYVDNWSMAGDLVIIAKTLRAVFQHTGAY